MNFGIISDFISYNGITDEFTFLKLQRDEQCYICGSVKAPKAQMKLDGNNQNELATLIKELDNRDTNKKASKRSTKAKKSSKKTINAKKKKSVS